jgi:superfamily II DNA or RNA helicase
MDVIHAPAHPTTASSPDAPQLGAPQLGTPSPDAAQSAEWDRYTRLPPDLQAVMRLKSLLVPHVGKSKFTDTMLRANLRTQVGRAWTAQAIAAAIEALQTQGMLTDSLDCPPNLLHPIAVEAAACAETERLVGGILKMLSPRQTQYYYGYADPYDREAMQRLLRLAVYTDDESLFVASRDVCDKRIGSHSGAAFLGATFAEVPLQVDWFASRRPAIQIALLETKFHGFLPTGATSGDLPALVAYARNRLGQDGFDAIRPLVLRYDLLRARLDELRAGAAALDNAVTKGAIEGTVAFLQGRNDDALLHLRAALKLHRKRLGKRKVFLDGEHGLFFVMALLHAADPALHQEIEAGIEVALPPAGQYWVGPHDGGFLAMRAVLWLARGLEPKARALVTQLRARMPAEPLSAACVALAEFFVDQALTRANEADLASRFAALRDSMPLIARIHGELLAEVAAEPAPYRTWLAATGGDGMFRFARLIKTSLAWERALETLDTFLGEGDPDAPKAPRKAKRLAWFLDPETQNVEAVEQSAKGRDGWTDGRPVAMKRLHEQDPRLDYLTPQDRLALRAMHRESVGYYDESYIFDAPRAIPALVGHPALFHASHRSQKLELVSYPLELVVTGQSGGYRIALSHTALEPTVFLEAETPSRYRVIAFPESMLGVQEILGPDGLTVPAAARDRVVAMARHNNPALPVRAEIAEIEHSGIEGQAAPVVQLVPYEGGLRLSLVVRPFGADGPAYVAGLGGRSVLATVAGQQLRASRDLAREVAERAGLIEACPTLRDRAGTDAHELVLDDLESCLELLLELRGYAGPLAVEWPEGRTMRVSPVEPGKLKLKVGQDRDWFSVDGSVALDEDEVLEMRFLLERLDKTQGRFVPLGDGRFVALTRQLQAQLQRLTAVSEPHKKGRRVHALGAPALDAVLEEAGEVKADAAWKQHVARIRAAEGWTPVLPATLQAELRDYQVEGFVWMSRLARWGAGACLADDMGLGKTVQAIAVMLDRAEDGPCLVVAPTSVCPNWEAEIARFAPTLRTHRLAGDRSALIAGLGARDVLVCSYGLLHQAAEELGARPWQMVVLDEAQAIKNAETKRAQATSALQAGFRLALTGTPVENYLDELWSLFNFVNPGVLGSRDGFQKRFARPIERDRDPHARQALRALLRPFLLRRTKAAVLSELPPRTEQTMNVEMTEQERVFYEALRQQSLERIAASDAPSGRRKIQILAEITRLRRACCNPALIDAAAMVPSGKLEAFLELVEELVRNRHRALVFSQFVGHLELVRAALDARGVRYEYLDGSTPSSERERRVAAFQAGGADLFLISLRAGGTGLNLTAADYVVHLDPWWNPAVEDQASDRAHRIGQERPVTIYRLIMQDSIEERILQLHRDKRDLASDILEGGEVSARLSEEALLDLIRA